MKGYLKTSGWVFKLEPKTTTVGRHGDCDLCLQNGGVDEHHALIEWSDSERCFVLSDLNSAHGTYVNGCRIHNAAVRLSPGDELHFGYGGSTYQLAVDIPSPLLCPPMNDRPSYQSSLQLIEEPTLAPSPSPLSPSLSSSAAQLPFLAPQSSAPVAWVWGGSSVTPRPPSRARPASAGAKRVGKQTAERGTAPRRPGSWTGNTEKLRQSGPSEKVEVNSPGSQTLQHLLQDKEERLLRLGDELQRLAVFEGESQRKDGVIAGLRDEVSALRHQLTLSQAQPEIKHRLRCLERDINDKKEQIQRLKEQMLEVQQSSVEMSRRSVTEKDLKICSLRGQMDRLKRDGSTASGVVASLQRDLASRDKQTLNLASEVDRLRQDIRAKDIQLGFNATKFTKMTKRHQDELAVYQNEVSTLKKSIENLEGSSRERQRCLEQCVLEKAALKSRFEKELEEQTTLLAAAERQRDQQRGQAELVENRVEHFRCELLKALHVDDVDSTSHDALSDQQVSKNIEKMNLSNIWQVKRIGGVLRVQVLELLTEVLEQRKVLETRAAELEHQLTERDRAAGHTETLRTRLESCQSLVQEAGSSDALQRAMSTLQEEEEGVCPGLAWVQASVLSLLGAHHALLQSTSQVLLEAGVESPGDRGVLSDIQALSQEYLSCKAELQQVKVELEEVSGREGQSRELLDQLTSATEQLEELKQQVAVGQQEEEARQRELEDLRGEVETLKQAQSALQEETRNQEAEVRTKLREEVAQREEECRGRVREAEERGREVERERYRVQEEEYREQVRQHAHTIVALEQCWVERAHTARSLEEERSTLREQIRDLEGKLERKEVEGRGSPSETTKLTTLEETITSLRAQLAQSQLEACSQCDIIGALRCNLATATARISDMAGQLSEQQKLEVEQHRALVEDQRVGLSTLTHKLEMMSQLLEQKGEELTTVRAELRQCQVDLEKKVCSERVDQERTQNPEENWAVARLPQHTKDEDKKLQALSVCLRYTTAEEHNCMVSDCGSYMRKPAMSLAHAVSEPFDVATLSMTGELAQQGSKCRGHRHDKVIQQQREALEEMRARIRALQQAVPMSKQGQSGQQGVLKRQQKGETGQLSFQRSPTTTGFHTSTNGWPQAPGQLGEETLERIARLDLLDALDLSERTYLDLARALCEALELSEARLEGCLSLQHLPQEERTLLGSLRQHDLELLRSHMILQHSQAQRRDAQLQEQGRVISSLRESQAEGLKLLDTVRAELETEAQESSMLREALRRTQSLLDQETSRSSTGRSRKMVSQEKPQKKTTRVASHSCVPTEASEKASVKKCALLERLKKREYEVETLKRQLGEKERQVNNMAAQLADAQEQREQQDEQEQQQRKQAEPVPEPC
ncbi:forkhead-associated domain-containing protein 1 [Osmerus mordax]|uniref:forkhead-associated domain-containing protein 1 n=1 Tax=Osmerus mordax TaxID=8014 RepID=UPI00351081FF